MPAAALEAAAGAADDAAAEEAAGGADEAAAAEEAAGGALAVLLLAPLPDKAVLPAAPPTVNLTQTS